MATWEWHCDPSNDDADEALVWERLRIERNRRLADSDARMVEDAPWDRDAWKAYRQALRDLPANTTDPRDAVWPTPPAL